MRRRPTAFACCHGSGDSHRHKHLERGHAGLGGDRLDSRTGVTRRPALLLVDCVGVGSLCAVCGLLEYVGLEILDILTEWRAVGPGQCTVAACPIGRNRTQETAHVCVVRGRHQVEYVLLPDGLARDIIWLNDDPD